MRSVVGLGLVALDVLIDERTDERLGGWAGGSCGNVLTILAWLGWDVAPVARLAEDANGQAVRADFRRHDVDTKWVGLGDLSPTPVYIERLRQRADGSVTHHFDRYCGRCGGRLPGYQPVPQRALGPVIAELESWDAVYIDRPSAGAVTLAQEARSRGKLVVFEPSSRGVDRHLRAIAAAADIVKYSADRLTADDRSVIAEADPPIEIETLGDEGLRFRTAQSWHRMRPLTVVAQDSAGAGDWTTAGLLHALRQHATPLEALRNRDVREMLSFAQAMGAWSCRFRAPRGAMDTHTPMQAIAAARQLLRDGTHPARSRRHPATASSARWACTACD